MRTNSSRGDSLYLIALMVAGLLLRLDFLFPVNFVVDADEAIVGLMAKHINETGAIPVFYYGQHYMGSLEPLLVSFFFSWWGMSNEALKAVPLIFSIALIPIVYAIGREVTSARGARIAALLMAIPPSALMVWSSKARGGFIELIAIGALSLLLLMRWYRSDAPRLGLWFFTTLLLGVGWWVNNQIVYFMLPAGFAFATKIIDEVWREGRWTLGTAMVLFLTGLAGFIVGGLPYWLYNFQHDFVSFQMLGASGPRDILNHVVGLFTVAIPIILGGRRDWNVSDYIPGSSFVAVGVYSVLALTLLVSRIGAVLRLFALKLDRRQPIELLWILVAGAGAIFAMSSFGFLSQAPRYLLPTYVGIFPLAAAALIIISEQSASLSRLFVVLLVGLNLLSCYAGGRAVPGEPFVAKGERVSRDHEQLLTWLRSQNIAWIRTNYWIGYRVAFETQESVRFLVFQQPLQRRIAEYEKEGRAQDVSLVPYVLVPSQAPLVARALTLMGFSFERHELSGYVVLSSIKPSHTLGPALSLSELRAHSSTNDVESYKAIDGDVTTRWGAGAPQSPGMQFELSLPRETQLTGVEVDLGHWWHDYSRGLTIEAIRDDGAGEVILSESDYDAIRYTSESEGGFLLRFPERAVKSLRFIQRGSHPLFDWSFAEIRVFGAVEQDPELQTPQHQAVESPRA